MAHCRIPTGGAVLAQERAGDVLRWQESARAHALRHQNGATRRGLPAVGCGNGGGRLAHTTRSVCGLAPAGARRGHQSVHQDTQTPARYAPAGIATRRAAGQNHRLPRVRVGRWQSGYRPGPGGWQPGDRANR
ncbi:MAG: hypothetical protein DRN07_05740, partial [Thermoplasmata archaeon]